jgi:predicted SAM-dependent methyltransferase
MTRTPSQMFAAINLACGDKLCREEGWVNADHSPSERSVLKVDLLKPLPFPAGTFDVVYHSQFMEHLPEHRGRTFLTECHRILKPGGVLRVVTPDLQNQAVEYLRALQALLADPADQGTRLRYRWMRLELLDQLNRHSMGGEMVEFLRTSGSAVRDYLVERLGRSGENLVPTAEDPANASTSRALVRGARKLKKAAADAWVPESVRVGRFRLSGEVHLCMYDEYLLGNVLADTGYTEIERVDALKSRIPNWERTRLDSDERFMPDCGTSLFMEATKPG